MLNKKSMSVIFTILISLFVLVILVIAIITMLTRLTDFMGAKNEYDKTADLKTALDALRIRTIGSGSSYFLDLKDNVGACIFDKKAAFNQIRIEGNLSLKYINETIRYDDFSLLSIKYKDFRLDYSNSSGIIIFNRDNLGKKSFAFYTLPSYVYIENKIDFNGIQNIHVICFNKSANLDLKVIEKKDIQISEKIYNTTQYKTLSLGRETILQGKCKDNICDSFSMKLEELTLSIKKIKITISGKSYELSEGGVVYLSQGQNMYALNIVSMTKDKIFYTFAPSYVTPDKLELPEEIYFDWIMMCYNREYIPLTESTIDDNQLDFKNANVTDNIAHAVITINELGNIRYSVTNAHPDCGDINKYNNTNNLEFKLYKKDGTSWNVVDNGTVQCGGTFENRQELVNGTFKLTIDKRMMNYTLLYWTDTTFVKYENEAEIFSDYKTGSKMLNLRNYLNNNDLNRPIPKVFVIDMPNKIAPIIGSRSEDTTCIYDLKDATMPIVKLQSMQEGNGYKLYGVLDKEFRQYIPLNFTYKSSTSTCDYYSRDPNYFIYIPEMTQNISIKVSFKEGQSLTPVEKPSFVFKKTTMNNPLRTGEELINTNKLNMTQPLYKEIEVKEGVPYLILAKCGAQAEIRFFTYFPEIYSKLTEVR